MKYEVCAQVIDYQQLFSICATIYSILLKIEIPPQYFYNKNACSDGS